MTTPSLEEPVSQAEFIFIGTVEETGASAVSELEATETTAVVRVDEVVKGPAAFAGLAGQQVTVLLRDPSGLEGGQTATFFVNGVLFGDGIAVEEVANRELETGSQVRARVAEAGDRLREGEVGARVATADLVVDARVARLRSAVDVVEAEPGLPGPLSEHYPDWMEATLDVQSVLKGVDPPGPPVLLFPNSIDVMWANAPKFHVGQEGIWLLHTEQVPQSAARALPSVYTALAADDFHPREQSERIQGMIQALEG